MLVFALNETQYHYNVYFISCMIFQTVYTSCFSEHKWVKKVLAAVAHNIYPNPIQHNPSPNSWHLYCTGKGGCKNFGQIFTVTSFQQNKSVEFFIYACTADIHKLQNMVRNYFSSLLDIELSCSCNFLICSFFSRFSCCKCSRSWSWCFWICWHCLPKTCMPWKWNVII